MDDYLPLILAIVLSINGVLFIAQGSITNLQEELGTPSTIFFNGSGSLICDFEKSNCTGSNYVLDNDDPIKQLPDAKNIETEEGGLFSDIFSTIKDWITGVPGVGFLINIVSAPGIFIYMLGLPDLVSMILATIWYLFTLFILVAWMLGR